MDSSGRALRLTVDQIPHGMLVLDAEGVVVAANRQAEMVFGATPGQLLSHPIEQFVPDATATLRTESASAFLTPGETLTLGLERPVPGIRCDGVVVPLEVCLRTMTTGHTRHVVAAVSSVADRLRLEARLITTASCPVALQRAIADFAVRLAMTEAESLDADLQAGLRHIAEVLRVDRAILWQHNAESAVATPTHYWTRDGVQRPEPLSLAETPYLASKLAAREATWFDRITDAPDTHDRDTFLRHGMRAAVIVPVASVDGVLTSGALAMGSATECEWLPGTIEQMRTVGAIVEQALARTAGVAALRHAIDEPHRSRGATSAEGGERRPNIRGTRTTRLIVSEGPAIRQALAQAEQVAATPATVLLLGETGAGKEVFAQAIHDLSPRSQHQMVRVSCAAIPSALIESELFGRERGAYTGALTRQIGRFEAANHSTLFLDEIGELPAEVQVKLLRVLQERVIERLGSTQSVKVDVRIIAATNRNLEKAVEDKTFREDLFYRLNVFPIVVPPLRERLEDIPGLVWEFVDEFSKAFAKPIESIAHESMRQLQLYPWPGNVRELRNVIERAVIIATGPRLTVNLPQLVPARQPAASTSLKALELDHIRRILESANWRIRGAGGAAERLGLKPTTLEGRMAKLGLVRPKQA